MKTMLNIKTDSVLKKKAQEIAQDLGLPLSVILNNYLKEFINSEKVVFERNLDPSARTGEILKKTIADLKKGKDGNFSPVFENTEDAMNWLNE
jgi:addiction module RelB/DinJ family antitoxin